MPNLCCYSTCTPEDVLDALGSVPEIQSIKQTMLCWMLTSSSEVLTWHFESVRLQVVCRTILQGPNMLTCFVLGLLEPITHA